ncbi:MAG: hypothetical protein ABI612_00710 [Betaproteobacteria bacterium]
MTNRSRSVAATGELHHSARVYVKANPADVAVNVAFAVLAVLLTAFLVWTTFRGFDLWDEGFYLIMARHPADIGAYAGSYYYYTGALFSLSGFDIPTFRSLGILCLFASTLVLAFGLRAVDAVLPETSFGANNFVGFVGLVAFLFLGTLVYYGSFARPTPSYNLLTNLCLTAATGVICLALAAFSRARLQRATAWMFVAGLFVGLQFFAKAPSAALMSVVVLIVIVLWPQSRPAALSRLQLLVAFGAGAIAWLLVHFALFESLRSFLEKLHRSLDYWGRLGIKIDAGFIVETVKANGRLLASMLKQSWPAVIVFGALWWSYKKFARDRPAMLVRLCWIAILCVVVAHIAGRYHVGGYSRNPAGWRLVGFYFFWAGALFATLIFLKVQKRSANSHQPFIGREHLVLMGLLGAIPFVGAFGTTGPQQIVLIYNWLLAPWFALLAYLAARVESQGLPLRIPAQLAIAGFVAAQLVTGYLHAPYGNTKGVLELRSATTMGNPPTTLLLDERAHDAVETLKGAATSCGFHTGDRILGFYGVPGMVYALGGRVVSFPAFTGNFWETTEISAQAAEVAVAALPYTEAHNAFVLSHLRTFLDAPELRAPGLKAIGRKFPDDYKLCGSAVWPFDETVIELWKPIDN